MNNPMLNPVEGGMITWRVCLQIVLFLLIVFWVCLCAKLCYDAMKTSPCDDCKPTNSTVDCSSKNLHPYNLFGGRVLALRHRNAFLGLDRELVNSYSSRLVDIIYRTALEHTINRKRQLDFEQCLKAMAVAKLKQTSQVYLVRAADFVIINPKESIDAKELIAADDYNYENYGKGDVTDAEEIVEDEG